MEDARRGSVSAGVGGGERLNTGRSENQGTSESRKSLSPVGLEGQRKEEGVLLVPRMAGYLVDAGALSGMSGGAVTWRDGFGRSLVIKLGTT